MDKEEYETLKNDLELQKSACSICGKTLQQRKDENYDLEDDDIMIWRGQQWSSPVCPVCEDILEDKICSYIATIDEYLEDTILKLFEEMDLKLVPKPEGE